MKRTTTLLVCLFLSFAAMAQVEKPYFQILDIDDDAICGIDIETFDDYEIRTWNGVQLMAEMSIRLDGGSMDLLGLVIQDGRYAYDLEKQGGHLVFKPKVANRQVTKLKHNGEFCKEIVKLIIYIPEEFEVTNNVKELTRKDVMMAAVKQ